MGWIRKTLLALGFICFGVGIAGAWVVYSSAEGFRQDAATIDLEKTAPSRDVNRLSIHSDFSDVVFVRSEDDDIHFRLAGTTNDRVQHAADIDLTSRNGTVTADLRYEKQQDNWFNFNIFELVSLMDGSWSKLRFEVALPDRSFQEIELTTDAGDIEASRAVRADKLSLRTSFGRISVDEYGGDRLELQTDAGRIEARRIAATEKVKAKTSFGNIDMSLDKVAEKVELSTDTGNIEAEVPQGDALRVDLKNDSGGIDVDVAGLKSRDDTDHSFQGSVGSGGPLLEARSSFGSIEIREK
ncbi:DUF4097 family beta strand repeat-containing protein [Paenibacillus flagellatus]|uniref:DUF4097 domain-containing protein n=1 Tax=Paenibacillus flagellatus TaxID=2211139 RepID=A0A2V5KKN6_9BACL|nr:DUF4097 family beta strand repeat-containing protein [Paenibacillus flagellatus]PYI51197.1 hypothetical protein DLM86_26290 [Paenibacillus flagellatus]